MPRSARQLASADAGDGESETGDTRSTRFDKRQGKRHGLRRYRQNDQRTDIIPSYPQYRKRSAAAASASTQENPSEALEVQACAPHEQDATWSRQRMRAS